MAAAAGHVASLEGSDAPAGSGRPNRWVAVCTCGYRSAWKPLKVTAVGSAVHHISKVAAELSPDPGEVQRNGGGIPRTVRRVG